MNQLPSGSIPGPGGGIWKMPSGSAAKTGEVLIVGDASSKTLVRQRVSSTSPSLEATGGYVSSLLPPPTDPALWYATDDVTVFDTTQISQGNRISPISLHTFAGQYILLYQGNDAPDSPNKLDSRLAWSTDLVDWEDHGIIFGDPSGWEGSRRRVTALIYDANLSKWVLFYGGNGSVMPNGRRAIGYATADDITGPYTAYASNPIIDVATADISSWAPGSDVDAAYGKGAVYVDGMYHVLVYAGSRTGSRYALGILSSASPSGPWVGGDHNPLFGADDDNWEDGLAQPTSPVFCVSEQRWYIAFHNLDGQESFAYSANADIRSSWTKLDYPVFDVLDAFNNMNNVVFPMPGGNWGCLAAVGGNPPTDEGAVNTKVKLITSHISPLRIKKTVTGLRTDIAAKLTASNNLSDVVNKGFATNTLLTGATSQSIAWNRLAENLPVTEPAGSRKPWLNNGVLTFTDASAATLSGSNFPGETVTSTNEGQWAVGGVDVDGEVGLTYVIRVTDVGKNITQTVNGITSDPFAVWKPSDVSGVQVAYLGDRGALASTGPDVNAILNDPVAQWNDQSGNDYHATQSIAGLRPDYRTAVIEGADSLRFLGTNDETLSLPAGALDVFNNTAYGYLIAAARDDGPTSGSPQHLVITWSENGNSTARFSLMTRVANATAGVVASIDDGGRVNAASAQEPGWNVLTGEGLFAADTLNFRMNGTQTATTSFGGARNTAATTSQEARIGEIGGQKITAHVACVFAVSRATPLTETERSQLERYAGLLIGKDIPLA